MPTFTDWKSDKSDGTLPNTEDAGIFQYRHFIHWETVQSWGAGIGRKGTGTWTIQIKDPSGIVIFEQTVQISVSVLFFGFVITWFYYEDEDVYTTTIVDGQQITADNPVSTYLVGAEEGDMIPGGDTVSGDIIDAFYESAVYKMSVPVGSTFHVIDDRWGLGVQTRPDWQWRFGDGSDFQIDSTFDSFGFLNSVTSYKGTSDLLCQRSLPNHTTREQLAILSGSDPVMAVLRNGKTLLIKKDSNDFGMHESLDAMMSFQKRDDELLQGSVTMPHLVALRGGGYLQLAKSAGEFKYIRVGPDGAKTNGAINDAAGYKELSAAQADNGVITLINETGAPVASSADDGVSFQ